MKRCTRCETVKPASEFPSRKRAKDGKASWCRDCFQVNWRGRYYGRHAEYKLKHSESRNRLRGQKALEVFEYLKLHPCVDCGEADPIVLEFDHRGEARKVESVAQMVINNASWSRILVEIEKCEVRCANCHRRKTAAQFSYKRYLFSIRNVSD
jgi:hypothetical protein